MKHNKFWFETNKKGFGFAPIAWEGWLATLLLMTLILISVQTNGFFGDNYTSNKALRFIFDTFVLTSVFFVAIRTKTKTH